MESGESVLEKQIKSKKRVADHGEVFTAEREVKAMCDLVKHETERIDSRFLEPACGDGNFLSEILNRKLQCPQIKKYKKSPYDWERYSLLALGSLYGVDILFDNVLVCRERLFDIWEKEYKKVCKKAVNDDTRLAAKFILKRNIVCGDALNYHCVSENGEKTDRPIVFSEWSFPRNDAFIRRKDYSFDNLVNGEKKKKVPKVDGQIGLFDEEERQEDESVFIREYISNYRRLGDSEE